MQAKIATGRVRDLMILGLDSVYPYPYPLQYMQCCNPFAGLEMQWQESMESSNLLLQSQNEHSGQDMISCDDACAFLDDSTFKICVVHQRLASGTLNYHELN